MHRAEEGRGESRNSTQMLNPSGFYALNPQREPHAECGKKQLIARGLVSYRPKEHVNIFFGTDRIQQHA